MMCENMQVTQKAAIGSNTNQIAIQKNYYGLSAKEASELAIQLFLDNFPKLQEEAARIAQQRAGELCESIIDKLQNQGQSDYSAFAEPDMQFVLNKAQQEYARFGTDDLCELLSSIIVNRVNYNDDIHMKIVLDEAVESAKALSESHINYLSIIYMCKHLTFKNIKSLEDLKKHCEYICSCFQIPKNISNSFAFLDVLKLFSLKIGDAEDFYSRRYGFNRDEITKILPFEMKSIPADYGLSPIGIAIAIININNKTSYNLDIKRCI